MSWYLVHDSRLKVYLDSPSHVYLLYFVLRLKSRTILIVLTDGNQHCQLYTSYNSFQRLRFLFISPHLCNQLILCALHHLVSFSNRHASVDSYHYECRRLKTCQMFLSKNQYYRQFGPFPDVPLSSCYPRLQIELKPGMKPPASLLPARFSIDIKP